MGLSSFFQHCLIYCLVFFLRMLFGVLNLRIWQPCCPPLPASAGITYALWRGEKQVDECDSYAHFETKILKVFYNVAK